MPDTPKSFEEWWKTTGELIAHSVSWSDFARRCWHDSRASLPPKTAPDLDLLEGLATRREGDEGYLLPIRYRQPLLCLIAAARQAASPEKGLDQHVARGVVEYMFEHFYPEIEEPNILSDLYGLLTQISNMVTGLQRKPGAQAAQTAVGEGELLKRPRTRHVTGLMAHIEALQAQLREEIKAHKLAIAQRDEANQRAERFWEQIKGREKGEPKGLWEPKLAALDVSKPEEIERLEDAALHMDWMQVILNGGPPCFHLDDDGTFCGRAKRWPGHDELHKFIGLHALLSRLRSLPSEPQDVNSEKGG